MILIIVGAVVGLIIGCIFAYTQSEGLAIIVVPMMFVLFALIAILFLSLIPGPPRIERTDIVALKDNVETEGTFFLGSGQIDSELYYYYMTKSNGAYQIKKIENDSRVYIYTDSGTPYIEISYYHALLSPWLSFDGLGGLERVEIHIPENSIIYNYKVDME